MDPLTVLGAVSAAGQVASTACNVAKELYQFVKDTKNVSRDVNDLIAEIDSLNSILETVKSGLQTDAVQLAERRASSEDNRQLWESIQASLDSCKTTILRLDEALVDVRVEGDNFAKQAIRRVKLNLKDSEITAFRTQIRAHTNALQMALMMVNLRAACLAPGAVADELGPRIDKLQSMMELVHGSEADLKAKSLGVEPDSKLKQYARRVISSATTVSGNSEVSGSILGEGLDDEKMNKTLSWIPEPDIHEDYDALAPPLSDEHSVSPSTALTDYTASNAEDDYSDSDGDFQFEMVETTFARGTKKFDQGDFTEAQSILQRGLQLAEKLPLERKQRVLVADVKLKIATCIYNSPNPNEAEPGLFEITQEQIHAHQTDEGAIRRCQASHLLACLLFRQRRYSPAKSFCRKALIGRRRVLGKDHISYFESLSLLSQICEADGQKEDSGTYWDMIPDEVASKLVKFRDEDMLQSTSSPSRPSPANLGLTDGHTPSSSRGSTSPRLPATLPHRPTPTSADTNPMLPPPSPTSIIPASKSSSTETENKKVRRKSSWLDKLKRRDKSVPSTSSAVPPEEAVVDKEEDDIVTASVRSRPQQRRSTSESASGKPRRTGFLQYLQEKEENGDGGVNFPGLSPV